MSLCARRILIIHQKTNLSYKLILTKNSKLIILLEREIATQRKLNNKKLKWLIQEYSLFFINAEDINLTISSKITNIVFT